MRLHFYDILLEYTRYITIFAVINRRISVYESLKYFRIVNILVAQLE